MTVGSVRKIKLGTGELHLIEDLHLHLEETGGGKNEAKALSGKRRQQCKGPGAERSRVGRPRWSLKMPSRELQGQNPVSQVLSARSFCPRRVISLCSAFPPSGSCCLSIRRLPSDHQNSLCLKVPRAMSPGSGHSLGQPFSNTDKSGGINSPTPLPDGGTSQTFPAEMSWSCAKWDLAWFLSFAGFSSFSVPPPPLSSWLFLQHFLINDTLRNSCPWRWFQGIPALGSQWHWSKMNEEEGMRQGSRDRSGTV